jgi:hypothetical protein
MLNYINLNQLYMKKITFIFVMLIINVLNTYSQKTRDVLYLKNGSIINGTLFEISDNQYKIRTVDKSIFIFQSSEVDKFVKEVPGFEARKEKGLGFALEAGFLVGSQHSEYVTPFSFNCIASYTAGTKDVFGVGTGVEFIGQTYTPLFVEYKHLILNRKTTPFIFFRGGGLTHIAKDDESAGTYYPTTNQVKYKGGISLGIGTGLSWAKEDSETYLSFAYRYAKTSYTQKEGHPYYDVTYNNYYNRLEIKFGFKF